MKLLFSTLFSFALCAGLMAQTLVTFQVDMNVVGANPAGVFIAGSFQGWVPGASQLLDPDGDGVYTLVVDIVPNTTIQWKYLNGPSWGMEETVPPACGNPADNNNRSLVVGAVDIVLPVVCYGECQACNAAVITTDVTMTVLTANITVAVDGMFIAGAFNGWTGEAMVDNGNGSWSITKALAAASYEFKFQNGNGGWEVLACGGNRSISFLEGDAPFTFTGCYAQCSASCIVDPAAADVTFEVDANQIVVDPAGIYLIGSFTTPAWQGGAVLMTDPNADGIYTATVNIAGAADIQFKFNNGDPFPLGVADYTGEENGDFITGGCGVDNGVGGSNRLHTRSGLAETLAPVCFNSCVICSLVPPSLVLTVAVCAPAAPLEVRLTGALWAWDTTIGPLATDNGDGTWSVTIDPAPATDMEYLWVVDGVQEDLLAETIAGGTCAPSTDMSTYAYRLWVAASADPTGTYNQCGVCSGIILGCTYAVADNYVPLANDDDGSCLFTNLGGTCLGDLDGDGIVGTSDLLAMLATFGTTCI